MKTIFLALISLIVLGSGLAHAGDYTSSAHGDSSSGVDRNGSFPAYAIGNCAHCHEQHASIAGVEPLPSADDAAGPDGFCLLAQNFDTGKTTGPYVQDDNACFYCHTSSASGISLQTDVVDNNNYAATFGGDSADATGIMQAFNLTSYHNLNDVLNFAKTEWSSIFTDNSNPCSGCHNVHIAKQNRAYPGNPAYTAISKPSDHGNLWGDDANEGMDDYTSYYQPPYYSGGTNYEPDNTGTSTLQAAKTPDYNTFCTDCHNTSNVIASTTLGTNVKTIDWATTGGEGGGDKHGKNVATLDSAVPDPDLYVNLVVPYVATWTTSGLVLACTDCHEPHGAPNVMLIRGGVNGEALGGTIATLSTTSWTYLCERCHDCDTVLKLEGIHHDNAGAPYPNPSGCTGCHPGSSQAPIPCYSCHFHGGSVAVWLTGEGRTGDITNRRCF